MVADRWDWLGLCIVEFELEASSQQLLDSLAIAGGHRVAAERQALDVAEIESLRVRLAQQVVDIAGNAGQDGRLYLLEILNLFLLVLFDFFLEVILSIVLSYPHLLLLTQQLNHLCLVLKQHLEKYVHQQLKLSLFLYLCLILK